LAKPVVTGVALGALAFLSPYALTFSELQLMHLGTLETISVATLLLAVVAKLLAVAISMAGGWKGGFIIPMFFSGYCLGRAGAHFLPGHPNAVVLAVCLMVAINVGVTKTPVGSTLVVTEMAGMRLLPPALIAGMLSFFLTSNVYLIESQQQREGIHGPDSGLPTTRVIDEMTEEEVQDAREQSENQGT
jgi:H+/Cl- antiporter ClcA